MWVPRSLHLLEDLHTFGTNTYHQVIHSHWYETPKKNHALELDESRILGSDVGEVMQYQLIQTGLLTASHW